MKILIIALLILSSCSKQNETQPDFTEQNKAALIGTWIYSGRTISPAYDWDGNGSVETNIFPVMTSCQKTFHVKYEPIGGFLKLHCSTPAKTITWNLQDRGTTLKYVMDGTAHFTEKIISLNQTMLVTESKAELQMGVMYTFINTYTKQ